MTVEVEEILDEGLAGDNVRWIYSYFRWKELCIRPEKWYRV